MAHLGRGLSRKEGVLGKPERTSTPTVADRRRLREVRLVGRGGTGVVTAGELLGRAAVREGLRAQAIPTFGPERRGALCSCTLRVGPDEILLRCAAARPDVLLILDPTIWHHAPVTLVMAEEGDLIFNAPVPADELAEQLRAGHHGPPVDLDRRRVHAVDATGIALKELGRAITNTTMMGALAGATGMLTMESIEAVLEQRFGAAAAANIEAARAGYRLGG
jgi:pyruvate ferredoxin oxidoreductase gamma subunit